MKHVGKKLLALLLVLSMLSGMSFNNVTIASAEETTAACITLSKNVKSEVEDTTYIYNGYKPNLGAKFTDSEKHSLVYYESRSVYNEESGKWSEASDFSEIVIGFASSLSEYAVTENTPGRYKYTWKAYCKSTGEFSKATYTVDLTVEDPKTTVYNMTFYVGQDNNGKNKNPKIKLYKTTGHNADGYDTFNEDDEIEITDNGIDASGQYRVYTASLLGATYSYRAYGYDESTDDYTVPMGGMNVNIPMASNVTQSGYDSKSVYIKCANVGSNSKYDGTNYLTENQYTTQVVCPYYNCIATPGTPIVKNNITYYPYMLIAQGNACLYNYFSNPNDDVADDYDLMYGYGINKTVNKGYSVDTWNAAVAKRITSEITVPDEAKAQVFFQMNNFNDREIESYKQKTNSDGTVTWSFYVPKSNGNYSYRVSKDGYVTKAGYMSLGSEESAKISVDLDRKDVTSHDFSKLGSTVIKRDEANLIMNVSDKNVKNLNVNDTFRLRAYRVWEIINSDAGNIMIEPDFNYQVLSGEDCINIEEVEDNRTNGKGNWLDITGVKDGIAVIAVTYNAIDVEGSASCGFYPAISPKRTGIVVINVGDKDSDILDVGVKNNNGKNWCWNYDTFFFDKEEGTMNIAPTAKSGIAKVEVTPVKTTDDLNSSLGDSEEITANEDGMYNVKLEDGNNIIKVTSNNGSVDYQVVRAAKIKINYENMSNPGEDIMPGDKVKITFNGLYRSIPKISGIFNPVILQVVGYDEDNNQYTGLISQYQVADNGSLEITVPKDVTFEEGKEETEYKINNGFVNLQSMYSYANAWAFMYTLTDAGAGTCFNAVNVTGQHSTIADFGVPVKRKVTYGVNFKVTDEQGNEIKDYDINVHDKNADEDVTNFTALGYGKYYYTIDAKGYVVSNSTFSLGSKTETVDGTYTVNVVLKKATENAWDGQTFTEPQKDEDGTYLISTGAELAWFAQEVNSVAAKSTSTINGKLTKDIDLASHNFPQIGYFNGGTEYVYYGGNFEGNNHKIYNFRFEKKAKVATGAYGGLFGYIKGAKITNLSVDGEVLVSALSTVSVSSAYTGGVVAYADSSELTNITSNVNVSIKDYEKGTWNYIGGIAGYARTTVIKNSQNLGNITGNRNAAGIVGRTNSNIENCVNKGKVYSTVGFAGGIVAEMSSGSVKNCINTGAVESKTGGTIGGIVGYGNGSTTSVIENCISLGKVTTEVNSTTVGSVVGSLKYGTAKNCYGISEDGVTCGTVASNTKEEDCYTFDNNDALLYKYATGKDLDDCGENAKQDIKEITSKYEELILSDNSTEDLLNGLAEISNENFDKCILENENARVTVRVQSENKYIAVSDTIVVNGYLAESYGFTDSVEDSVSALDVLVAEHEKLYGDKFTESTADEYLVVSANQYGTMVSKAFGKDASTFMYAVNEKYPHNDTLVDGYYTGYTVDQAKVSDGDTADFYFLQDASYSDDLSTITLSTNEITTDKSFNLSLKGYNYAWYGACEQSKIDANTHAIEGAKVAIIDVTTGKMETLENVVTDKNGNASVNIDKAGKYFVTAYVDGEGKTPILMSQAVINVEWAKPLEVKGVAVAKQNKNVVSVMWKQDLEQIRLGQIYNVYVDGGLYNKYPAASTITYTFDKPGKHTIKITAELNGFETEGKTVEIEVEKETTTEKATSADTTAENVTSNTTEPASTEDNVTPVETTGDDITKVETSAEDNTTTEPASTEDNVTPVETTSAEDNTTTESVVSTTAETTSKVVTTGKKTPTTKAPKVTKKVINKIVKVKKAVKKKSSKKISIKLQKIKRAKGYEVRIATNKKFTGKKVIKIRTKKISFVYKKLKPNKKYYVKARFYRIIKGKKVYGKWGKAKKVTFK